MKKVLLFCLLLSPTLTMIGQSEKYTAAMKEQIAKIETAMADGSMPALANNFERIADAEKTQWLPYYYASYCTVMTALAGNDVSKNDALADKADALITKAETLAGGPNSETNVIRSLIASTHMMTDPASRWQQYGPVSASHIEKAKQLDPTNPRPVLLEGQSIFYTPEQFGGGKTPAAPIFEKAKAMFGGFKPATDLSPTWGKSTVEYFIAQCK